MVLILDAGAMDQGRQWASAVIDGSIDGKGLCPEFIGRLGALALPLFLLSTARTFLPLRPPYSG